MTTRTVAVDLTLNASGFARGAQQGVAATEELAAAAAAAGAESQAAIGRAGTGIQSSMQRAARAVGTFGQEVQAVSGETTAGMGRMEAAARGAAPAFGAVGQSGSRAFGAIAESSMAAASAVAAADTRMAASSVAAAQGIQASLATRLAVAEAVVAQEAAMATATTRSAAATQTAAAASARSVTLSLEQRILLSIAAIEREAELAAATEREAAVTVGAYGRMTAAVTTWATAARTSAATARASAAAGIGTMATGAEQGEKALGALRTTGLALMATFAAAVYTAAKFEKAMSGVYAVADATDAQMKALRQSAIEAGRDTAYSASQAANAEAELARAGVSVADITGGALKGSLGLAAAGQLDLAESAVISAQAMNTFNLRGGQVTHIADVLAAGANKSAADVHGLGESLRMGGLLAHQTGLSLEDTVGVLSMFADHALIGSDAGTSLKVMLQRLVPQSGEAYDAMQKLGFSAYDAQGNFIGLTALAGMMQRSFGALTPEARNAAMATIFGSDAVRSATILYEQGAAGVDQYRNAVNDAGAAQRMAAVQMDNLMGDLEKLRGSLEVALIQGGTDANGVLRDMVQWVTDVVNAYAQLPPWLQTSASVLALVAGAVALVSGGMLLALPRVMAFRASMAELATTMPRVAAGIKMTMAATGVLGAVLALATVALSLFGDEGDNAKQVTEDLTAAVQADGAAVGANTRAWIAHKLEQQGALEAAAKLGISTEELTSAILGQGDAATKVKAEMAALYDDIDKVHGENVQGGGHADGARVEAMKKVSAAFDDLNPKVNSAVASAKREAEATGSAAGGMGKLGAASKITAGDMADTRTEADKLKDSLDRLNGANIDAAGSAIRYQKSLSDLRDTVKENGRSLDITTEKGRAVKSAFLDAASAAMTHAEAVQKQTGSTEQAQIVLQRDIDALKETMRQAGFTATQIDSLTAAYARVPGAVQTQVTDPGAQQVIQDLQAVRAKADGLPPGKSITIRAPSGEAIQDLEAIGYKVDHLPDGKVKVTVPTDDAFDGVTRIDAMIRSIANRSVRVTVQTAGPGGEYQKGYAAGGIVHAANGFTVPGYAPRRDTVPAMLSPGEGVLVPETTRLLGGASGINALNAWGRNGTPLPADLIPARQLVLVGAPAAPAAPPAGRGDGGFHIENYYESADGSARSTAEDLEWMRRVRG